MMKSCKQLLESPIALAWSWYNYCGQIWADTDWKKPVLSRGGLRLRLSAKSSVNEMPSRLLIIGHSSKTKKSFLGGLVIFMQQPRIILLLLLIAIILQVTSEESHDNILVYDIDNALNSTLPAQTSEPIHDVLDWELQHAVNSTLSTNHGTAEPALTNEFEPLMPKDYDVDKQWSVRKIEMFMQCPISVSSREVIVAILDTGIDKSHEDLEGLVIAEADFTDSSSPNDICGHGTHVAAIIAAKDNGVGVVGVLPECRLLNVKVADDNGRCEASVLAKGIIWSVNNRANVINISVELKQSSPELEDAVNYAWSEGAVVVAAAGNDGSESPVYPAYYENCVAVAAIKQGDILAPLSNHGDWVDVGAPGFNIYSSLPNHSYGYKTGTSFATAYVSGFSALLFNVVTDTNGDGRINDDVRTVIEAGYQEIAIYKTEKNETNATEGGSKSPTRTQ